MSTASKSKKAATQKKPHLRLIPTSGGDGVPAFADKYQAIFNQASDAVMTVIDGQVDEVNEAFCEMTGYRQQEFKELGVQALKPGKKHHVPALSKAFDQGMLKSPGVYEDVAVLRKDGYVRLVELNVRRVKNDEMEMSLALFRDVTDKKQLEREILTKHAELRNAYMDLEKSNMELKGAQESLVQAGKMAALGELSSGIAHELNQPLQGIRGFAQELESFVPPSITDAATRSQAEVCLQEIIRGADKMAKIIKYLRAYTRKTVEDIEEIDVHAVIEESLKLLETQFKTRGIEIVRKFGKLPLIQSNPVQLEQIFINFATNARDAIEAAGRGSGCLTITTKAVTKNKEKFVEISYRDDGIGMDEQTRKKVFNPFFTTKEVGKGMGLGMSISYGILHKLQGSILVESEVGKGSTFVVQLPMDYRIN